MIVHVIVTWVWSKCSCTCFRPLCCEG